MKKKKSKRGDIAKIKGKQWVMKAEKAFEHFAAWVLLAKKLAQR